MLDHVSGREHEKAVAIGGRQQYMKSVEPTMENCVDVIKYGVRKLVVLKRPGSPRHPDGHAVEKIEMTMSEGKQMARQLVKKLHIKEKWLYGDSEGTPRKQPKGKPDRAPVRVQRRSRRQ